MVSLDNWNRICKGYVRLVQAGESCKSLEEAVSRVNQMKLDLYGPIFIYGYKERKIFEPMTVLPAMKHHDRMRDKPLSGVSIAIEKDEKFYIYYHVIEERIYFPLEPRIKIPKVELKEPQVFKNIDLVISYAKDRGFNLYDTMIIQKAFHSTQF